MRSPRSSPPRSPLDAGAKPTRSPRQSSSSPQTTPPMCRVSSSSSTAASPEHLSVAQLTASNLSPDANPSLSRPASAPAKRHCNLRLLPCLYGGNISQCRLPKTSPPSPARKPNSSSPASTTTPPGASASASANSPSPAANPSSSTSAASASPTSRSSTPRSPAPRPTTPAGSQRKSNVVARFHRSSYAIGLTLEHTNRTFADRYNLPDADYAAHGGSFPIHVAGTGIIGAVTVSGLPQRDDHNLVVEALCLALKKDHDALRLTPPQ